MVTRTGRPVPNLIVRALSAGARRGWLSVGPFHVPCALGRSGIKALKREGDGASPRGRWPLRQVHVNRAHAGQPRTALPVQRITRTSGWCDAPDNRNYNRPVALPYGASTEALWREDGLYDLIVEVGYNDRPRRRGAGSAIFIHIARPGFLPTEGCIALRRVDLTRVLACVGPRTRLIIEV